MTTVTEEPHLYVLAFTHYLEQPRQLAMMGSARL